MIHLDGIAEVAYGQALVLIAQGESKDDTFAILSDSYESLPPRRIRSEMRQALLDAIKQGVLAEDLDPSWLLA